jgi:Zn-dependent protease with chaperone function
MVHTTRPIDDWNALDAERGVRHPGWLARFRLASKSQARAALREVGAVTVDEGGEPRFRNLVAGLSAKLGLGPVDLFLYADGGPNAITGRVERPFVCAARSLVSTYTRTELEAVVAHCLVRHRQPPRRWIPVGYADDVRAVALTRFPPALVSALRKAEPYRGRSASFYLVAEGVTHRPLEARIEALLDL